MSGLEGLASGRMLMAAAALESCLCGTRTGTEQYQGEDCGCWCHQQAVAS